ncbi:hypothetical protein PFLA_a1063 [Pseudoalteromonas flavipulchra NCIMB 2033 = ATCC BAA-314]|nr:hypothetical protein [Pseudoalteromonas flavipulchra NCIMB 2033 = ATCC BAA-314]
MKKDRSKASKLFERESGRRAGTPLQDESMALLMLERVISSVG